jgi:cytidyltransferase-like protein
MTVLTVGTFDILHSGHISLFMHCRRYAGTGSVIVGVNTDRFVATFKTKPVNDLYERKTVVEACRYVDRVIDNDDACLESMLLSAKPNYLLIGADWAPPRDYLAQIGTTQGWLDAHGIRLVYVPRPAGAQSSTKIKQAVVELHG